MGQAPTPPACPEVEPVLPQCAGYPAALAATVRSYGGTYR